MNAKLEKVKEVLSKCERHELRDNYFGDKEVTWTLNEIEVAKGYCGEGCTIGFSYDGIEYNNEEMDLDEASTIFKLGKLSSVKRNDSGAGDEEYDEEYDEDDDY